MIHKNSQHVALLHFLIELRKRLIYCLIIVFIIFTVLLYFANQLYSLLALPMLKFLPEGHLIATEIVSPFFVPFKLAFVTALSLGMPVIFYHVWAFIAPALYGHEKRFLWPLLFLSTLLFYVGILFAYFIIFPLLFQFLAHVAPQGVTLSPDISQYLDFTLKLLFVFGGLFEIPVVMFLLVLSGITQPARLKKMRPYAIVGAFVIGMLLAPPDVFSQTVLAIPIWLLYEVGIVLSGFASRKAEIKPVTDS